MFLVVLYIIFIKFEPSLSHFQPHTDFHKVGETVFNNEKYNILKITTHSISDYFENFVLRSKKNDFPSKRLFVDDNGFRHYWSGFEKKNKSLRKTEILTDAIDDNNIQDKVNDTENPSVTNNGNNEKNNSNESNIENSNKKYNSSNSNENLSKNPNSFESTTPEGDDIEVRTKKTDNKEKTLSSTPGTELRQGKTPAPKQKENLKERNVIQTTFYCPFFGVITLSAFADE